MKGIKEIRVDNLNVLIEEAGGRTAFTDSQAAIEQGITYGFVGQLVNKSRGIGDNTAKKLEIMGNKPRHWLDQSHNQVKETSAEYKITSEQLEWNAAYHQLDKTARDTLLATIRIMLKK
jgi:plasmid maintenance system antidote protein VapI